MTNLDDVTQEDWDTAYHAIMAAFAANNLGRKVSDWEMVARAIQAARLQEREECAKVAENCTIKDDYVAEIAAAIRARK